MKKAVCLLFERNGKFLAVSRKNNPNDFGLPGGKVDGDEDPIDALKREVFEETGYELTVFKKVFELKDSGYLCETYFGFLPLEFDENGNVISKSKEAGVVKMVTKNQLLLGTFGLYNKALFNKIEGLGMLILKAISAGFTPDKFIKFGVNDKTRIAGFFKNFKQRGKGNLTIKAPGFEVDIIRNNKLLYKIQK